MFLSSLAIILSASGMLPSPLDIIDTLMYSGCAIATSVPARIFCAVSFIHCCVCKYAGFFVVGSKICAGACMSSKPSNPLSYLISSFNEVRFFFRYGVTQLRYRLAPSGLLLKLRCLKCRSLS